MARTLRPEAFAEGRPAPGLRAPAGTGPGAAPPTASGGAGSAGAGVAPYSGRPLVVTADPDLLDDLLRIAEQADVVVDVAPDAVAAVDSWIGAVAVLVGYDTAEACVRAGLPSRGRVVVVGRAEAVTSPEPRDWILAQRLGAAHVVLLAAAEEWLRDLLADLTHPPRRGRVVTIVGGRGGAGASVLASGLAVTAAKRGLPTLLVDADPLGGGVDLVLGWEGLDGLRWPSLAQAAGRVPADAMVERLPGRAELVVLSWDRGEPASVPADAMLAALDAGRRGRELTVVDLPRRIDDASAMALRAADRSFLVVPAELRACAAAAQVAAMVMPYCTSLAVIVRAPGPGGLSVKEVVGALKLPYAGALRTEPQLGAALERGQPPAATGRGPLAALCHRLLDDVLPSDRRRAA